MKTKRKSLAQERNSSAAVVQSDVAFRAISVAEIACVAIPIYIYIVIYNCTVSTNIMTHLF